MKFVFDSKELETNWSDYVYFDIETVEDMQTLNKLKQNNDLELQKKYLDTKNTKYVCFAIHKKHKRFSDNRFRQITIDDFVYYYNVEPLTYDKIAKILVKVAIERSLAGFVAFNGTRFDFLIFVNAGYTVYNIKNSTFLQVKNHRFRLVDPVKVSITFGGYSLEKTAEKLSISEKKLTDTKDLKAYNVQDVKILVDVAKKFNDLLFLETTTRTGRKALYDFMKSNEIEKIESSLPAWVEYKGGRVETYVHYLNSGFVYDANSLYPSVISNFMYGRQCIEINDYVKLVSIKKHIEKNLQDLPDIVDPITAKQSFERVFPDYHYILSVRLLRLKDNVSNEVKRIVLTYFPFSFKTDEITRQETNVYQFNPTRTYQVQGYELYFLKYFDFEIITCCVYKTETNLFKDLYKQLYDDRLKLKQNNDSRELTVKIMMNSGYGTWGLRSLKKKIFTRNSIPLYAVLTTSHARFFMLTTIHYLVKQNYIVVYTDTDSVFTDCPPEKFLLIGTDMLQFKHEKSFENLFVFNPKTYIYTDCDDIVIKAKGTGRTFKRVSITQSIKRPNPEILTRYAVDLHTIPVKIPSNNFVSIYNFKKMKYFDAYKHLIYFALQFYNDYVYQLLEQDLAISELIKCN